MNNKINTIEDAINNPDGKSLETMHEENVKTFETAHERKLKESKQYRELAIKRDAAMFAVAEFPYVKEDRKEITAEMKLKKLHDKWLMYFEGVYGDQTNE